MGATTQRPLPTADTRTPLPAGDRFVATAALLVAAVQFAIQGLAGEVIVPLAVLGSLYLAAGVAVAVRRSRWLLAVIALLAIVHVVGSIPFFVENLSHPESPASFILEAFVALTVLTTLIGAVTGLVSTRPRGRGPVAIGAGVLAAVAVVVALVAAADVVSDPQQPGDIVVEAVASTFPDRVEVPTGGAVLFVDNQDPIHHTLVIEGTELREALPGSTAVRIDVDLAPGTYRYLCDVPGHERMQGELVVG